LADHHTKNSILISTGKYYLRMQRLADVKNTVEYMLITCVNIVFNLAVTNLSQHSLSIRLFYFRQ